MDYWQGLFNMDVRTLMSVLVWGNIVSVALLLSYRLQKIEISDEKLFKVQLLSHICQAIAFFLIFFRGVFPDILSVNIGNTLLFAAFYFEGCSIYYVMNEDKKHKYTFLTILLVAVGILFNIAEFLRPDSNVRVTVASLCVFTVIAIPSIQLVASKSSSGFKRIVGCFYLFFVVLQLPRAAYMWTNYDAGIFTNNVIQSLTFISLVLLLIFSLPAYLLLLREKVERQIESMAKTDLLTGVANRQSFLSVAAIRFERKKRQKKRAALLFMDLDHFKNVNDTYGHSFGDTVLRGFAQGVQSRLRDTDLFCRYGGEEFLVYTELGEDGDCGNIATRIQSFVEDMVFDEEPDFRFTVSIGVASGIPQAAETLMSYIDSADNALYEAKNTGRNKVVEYRMRGVDA